MSTCTDHMGEDSPWPKTIALAQARSLLGLWRDIPSPKARSALDPLAFGGRILPHLNIMRRVGSAGRIDDIHFDLVGGVIRDTVPRLRPGALALGGAAPDEDRTTLFNFYAKCLADKAPVAFTGQYLSETKVRTCLLCLCLPLDTGGDGPAESLLAGVWFLPVDGKNQDGPIGVFEEIPVGRLQDCAVPSLKM